MCVSFPFFGSSPPLQPSLDHFPAPGYSRKGLDGPCKVCASDSSGAPMVIGGILLLSLIAFLLTKYLLAGDSAAGAALGLEDGEATI